MTKEEALKLIEEKKSLIDKTFGEIAALADEHKLCVQYTDASDVAITYYPEGVSTDEDGEERSHDYPGWINSYQEY